MSNETEKQTVLVITAETSLPNAAIEELVERLDTMLKSEELHRVKFIVMDESEARNHILCQ